MTKMGVQGPNGRRLRVALMAPILGHDVSYLDGIDSIEVVDGNDLLMTGGDVDARRAEVLADTDVLILGFPVPPQVVRWAPRLQWIHHTQAGVSNLHRSDIWPSNVRLTSGRGFVAATAIAEYVIAGALFFARGLNEATRQKAAGTFDRAPYDMRSLAECTIGIIGLGGIGREVARLARAVGMRTLATRRSTTAVVRDVEGVDELAPADHLTDVAARSDVLVVCSQLTPETERSIDAAVFAAMPSHAVLVNVARGEEVDEDALIAAVRSGSIRGALLDVFDGDTYGSPPRPDLVVLPSVVLTPHLSSRGADIATEGRRLVRENVRRYLAGEPLLNEVDRSRGY